MQTIDSKANPNHQKHGTASPVLPDNGPANEDLSNGPLNPSSRGTPLANEPGHMGPLQASFPFEATPNRVPFQSSTEAVSAGLPFPSLSEAPHSSRSAFNVEIDASLLEGVQPPSDSNGDTPPQAPPNVASSLPPQPAPSSPANLHIDGQHVASGAVQGSSPDDYNERQQDGAVFNWDVSAGLLDFGLAPSGAQNAASDGETSADQEMEDAFANSEEVLDGGLDESAMQDRASEPEHLEPTCNAGPMPALEGEQPDEGQGASLDEQHLGLSNHSGKAIEDDVMGGETSGEDDLRVVGVEAMGRNEFRDEVGRDDEVSDDDMERDDVSGGAGDVSGQAGHCRCELTSEVAQLQLLVKLFDGRTVLVRADPAEGAEAVLERVR